MCISAGCLWISVSHKHAVKPLGRAVVSSEDLTLWAFAPKLICVVIGRPWMSPCRSIHRTAHSITACFLYYFYYNLFVRYESLNPAYLQTENITQRHKYEETGSSTSFLEATYYSHPNIIGFGNGKKHWTTMRKEIVDIYLVALTLLLSKSPKLCSKYFYWPKSDILVIFF